MPSTATFTANAIIVTVNDGQRKTERAYSKLACYGRVIEDVEGLDSGEKVLSIVATTGESLVSLSNNPSLYPGNTIDGKVDFDAAKTAVFDAIGLSGTGGGGGGGAGTSLTQSQTREAVKDGLDQSSDIEDIKNKPIAVFKYRVAIAHGTPPDNFTVGQEICEYIYAQGNSIWRSPGLTTALGAVPTRTNLEFIGGGGSASDYVDYEVMTAHNGLTVGQIVRETIGLNGTSTWAFRGGGTLPGAVPDRDNLELYGFSGLAVQLETGFTAVTGNQASITSLLSRNFPSKLVSQTAAAGQSVTLTIPVPTTTGQRNILTYINAGYHGAAFPAASAGVLSVDMGVDTLVFPGITSAGPAPLYQADSGLQADVNSTVVLTLPSIPNLIPTITVGYRTGPQ